MISLSAAAAVPVVVMTLLSFPIPTNLVSTSSYSSSLARPPFLVSDSCWDETMALYDQNPDLSSAHTVYQAAWDTAVDDSCDNLELRLPKQQQQQQQQKLDHDDGPTEYLCTVGIEMALLDAFESACTNTANGAIVKYGYPIGIDCCGEIIKDDFVTYGYLMTDKRICVAAGCTDAERLLILQNDVKPIFEAGDAAFFNDLGLVCGQGCGCGCVGGCDVCPPCAETTKKYASDIELLSAQASYYVYVSEQLAKTCLDSFALNPNNFECTDEDVDEEQLKLYNLTCIKKDGVLVKSNPVDISCSDELNRIKISLSGTWTCVHKGCDLDNIGAVIAEAIQLSPGAAFASYEETAKANGQSCSTTASDNGCTPEDYASDKCGGDPPINNGGNGNDNASNDACDPEDGGSECGNDKTGTSGNAGPYRTSSLVFRLATTLCLVYAAV